MIPPNNADGNAGNQQPNEAGRREIVVGRLAGVCD